MQAARWHLVALAELRRCAEMRGYPGDGRASFGQTPGVLLTGICWLAAGYYLLTFRAGFSGFVCTDYPDVVYCHSIFILLKGGS